MPAAAQPTLSSHQKSCCDKLCRWLNRAIRQHTVCLTKCFLSDTHELSWLLAAWFRIFIWASLWGSVSISGGFWFLSPLRPNRRGHMARCCWRGLLQLDYIFTLMEPCWISVVVQSLVLHLSDRGHFVSHSDIFADMFHLGTDVNVKEVQMEISAF